MHVVFCAVEESRVILCGEESINNVGIIGRSISLIHWAPPCITEPDVGFHGKPEWWAGHRGKALFVGTLSLSLLLLLLLLLLFAVQ